MILLPKSKGVWQSGSCFIAEDFNFFKGMAAVVIELEPIDIAWNSIHSRDFEVKRLGLGHLYLDGELGLFSVPPHHLITSEEKFYEALAVGMNAEFLSHVSLLLAERFETFLKTDSFRESERFTLLGLIKSFLIESEASLFRERVQNIEEHYAAIATLSPLEFERKLLALRKLLAQNIEAQSLILKEMAEEEQKIRTFDPELFDIVQLAAKVYTDQSSTPFSIRALYWSPFLKKLGIIPIFPGNPEDEKAAKAVALFG